MANEESKQMYLYCSSLFLDRAAYYGLRAILVLYMIEGALDMPREKALRVYGYVTAFLILSEIVGALLGDLVAGNKNTGLFGGLLFMLGSFLLCIEVQWIFYLGLGFVLLGSGFYGPNLFALFGKTISNKDKLMDSRTTLYYLASNLGAVFGIIAIGYLSERVFNYKMGFVLSGFLMLVSTLILFITKLPNLKPIQTKVKGYFSNNYLNLLLIIGFGSLYWFFQNMGEGATMGKIIEVSAAFSELIPSSLFMSIKSYPAFIIGLIAVFVWYAKYMHRFIKLFFGFLSLAIAFILFRFLPEASSELSLIVTFLSFVFFGLGETLVIPTISSLIIKYTPERFYAIVSSLRVLPSQILLVLGAFLPYMPEGSNFNLHLCILGLLIFGVLIYSLRKFFKDEPLTPKEIEEIGKES
ncbi:MFS transporter [Aureisphaera galaxeae]|uniref:MFS transporter n=1 Tax=Aureisphaera galaxeae TaxID=1538023 RepID=UPI002350B6BB|nr:MFS transporter [Aureisphaera galaxeae]MDC8003436.1 MFS transporter [Aureisphaera galaxeae]